MEATIKEVAGMQKPTILFTGTADALNSHEGLVKMAEWLHAEMVKVDGGTHYIEEEGRDAVYTKIEQFLRTHPTK